MSLPDKPHQPSGWTVARAGCLAGGLFGIVSGPFAMVATMWLAHYLHGATFLGLEIVGAPILGAIAGAIEGTLIGAISRFVVNKRRRLTIARLMLIVAISGPSLAFVLANPVFAEFLLVNGLLLLPLEIGVLAIVAQRHEEAVRSDQNASAEGSSFG
jgi:hypothetical protein